MRNKKKGFSLLELLIVVGIIGIIAVIAVPKYSNYVKTAKVKSDVASARTIADAFKLYFFEDGEKAISGLDLTNESNSYVEALKKYISTIPEVKSEDNAHFVVNTTEEGEIAVFIAEVEGNSLEDSDQWVQKYPVEKFEEQGDEGKE